MQPDDPRHGSPRGYRVHREHSEDACPPCAAAWYRYNKRATYLRVTGNSLRVPSLGTHRRVRALMALGYGLPTIAAELGIATGNLSYKLQQPYVVRATHEAVADVFERLAMQPPPTDWVALRTRNIARKRGWAPPLAWDDIDNPNETPAGTYQAHRAKTEIDEAVVLRILAGEHVDCTTAERDEVMRRWRDAGKPERELCARMGWQPGRYGKGRAA